MNNISGPGKQQQYTDVSTPLSFTGSRVSDVNVKPASPSRSDKWFTFVIRKLYNSTIGQLFNLWKGENLNKPHEITDLTGLHQDDSNISHSLVASEDSTSVSPNTDNTDVRNIGINNNILAGEIRRTESEEEINESKGSFSEESVSQVNSKVPPRRNEQIDATEEEQIDETEEEQIGG